MNRKRIAPALVAAFLVASSVCAAGAESGNKQARPAWIDQPYTYVVVDQSVRDALVDLGRNVKIPVVVDSGLKSRVRQRVSASTVEDFLTQLSFTADLAWYFDGNVLHASSQSAIKTDVIDIADLEPGAVRAMLPDLGVSGGGVSARMDGNVLRLAGPEEFLTHVRQNLELLQPTAESEVRVFRGGAVEVIKDLPTPSRVRSAPAKSKGSIIVLSALSN